MRALANWPKNEATAVIRVRPTAAGSHVRHDRSQPGWASALRTGAVTSSRPAPIRTRWLGLTRASTSTSIPNTECHAMSATNPNANRAMPAVASASFGTATPRSRSRAPRTPSVAIPAAKPEYRSACQGEKNVSGLSAMWAQPSTNSPIVTQVLKKAVSRSLRRCTASRSAGGDCAVPAPPSGMVTVMPAP